MRGGKWSEGLPRSPREATSSHNGVWGREERRGEEEASSWAWQNQLDGRGGGGGEKVSVKAPKTLFLQAHGASQERRGGKIAYLSPDSLPLNGLSTEVRRK